MVFLSIWDAFRHKPVVLRPRSLLIFTSVMFVLCVPYLRRQSTKYTTAKGEFFDRLQVAHIIDPSDWGLMGREVRRLVTWGEWELQQPSFDTSSFVTAITTRFPWMNSSHVFLKSPWAPPSNTEATSAALTGMVVCVGSSNFHLASHLVVTLRQIHKSNLPIEIAYAGDHDLNLQQRLFLRSLGHAITFIDLLQVFPHADSDLRGSGWAMKPFALLAAKHHRTILVDADAIFFAAPDDLFEQHSGLRQTGTLFYHDRAVPGNHTEQRVYIQSQLAVAGIPTSPHLSNTSLFYAGRSWYEQDSGVVAMDKSRPGVFLGLILAAWMNTKVVRDNFKYTQFYGDKDTYWIAMELSGSPYTFETGYAGTIGAIDDVATVNLTMDAVQICGKHMLHPFPNCTEVFWMNGGIYEDKSTPERGYARLSHYWAGDEVRFDIAPRWWWTDGNVACLEERGVRVLDDVMQRKVRDMVAVASEVDDIIKQMAESETGTEPGNLPRDLNSYGRATVHTEQMMVT